MTAFSTMPPRERHHAERLHRFFNLVKFDQGHATSGCCQRLAASLWAFQSLLALARRLQAADRLFTSYALGLLRQINGTSVMPSDIS